MILARTKRFWLPGLGLAVCLTAGGLLLFGPHLFSSGRKEAPEDRLLRAAYLLQRLGGPAAEEKLEIPRRIRIADSTESLRNHPDVVFVLRTLAQDLSLLTADGVERAPLFEAYARISLGETAKAGRLLARYVAENPYDQRHYALLCALLEQTGDFPALLLIAGEWRERDPVCREERLIFTWVALCQTRRPAEAGDLILRQGACLGWRRDLYAARAFLAAGAPEKAAELKARAEDSPGARPEAVEILWQSLLRMDLPLRKKNEQRGPNGINQRFLKFASGPAF
ncbi:MAG: hypothetical protein LBO77_07590 [Desulfovibrio sp.]|jgi:hypothetical protein|nr:hypothetical protein [Desulfovibrio sp.]